ncbi:hypothetical protein [Spirochaeta dissipatitropha]
MIVRLVPRVFFVVLFAVSTIGLSAETVETVEPVETRLELGLGVSSGGIILGTFVALMSTFISEDPTLALPFVVESNYWTRSGFGFGLELDNLIFASMHGAGLDTRIYPSIRWRKNADSLFSFFLVPFSAMIVMDTFDQGDAYYAVGYGEEYWDSKHGSAELIMSKLGFVWTWRPQTDRYVSLSVSSGAGFFPPLDLGLTMGISR